MSRYFLPQGNKANILPILSPEIHTTANHVGIYHFLFNNILKLQGKRKYARMFDGD